jgi:signal transduction histidine kinase
LDVEGTFVGFGPFGPRARFALVGGTVEVSGTHGEGTTIRATLRTRGLRSRRSDPMGA